jgi:hypothetical protein
VKQVRRHWLSVVVLMGAAVLCAACLAPTLPLPPPSRPEVSAPDESGMIHIRGIVRSKAEVFAKNQYTLDIIGKETDETGKYELTMVGSAHDRIIVWYTHNGLESDFAEVTVPETDTNSTSDGGQSGGL